MILAAIIALVVGLIMFSVGAFRSERNRYSLLGLTDFLLTGGGILFMMLAGVYMLIVMAMQFAGYRQ